MCYLELERTFFLNTISKYHKNIKNYQFNSILNPLSKPNANYIICTAHSSRKCAFQQHIIHTFARQVFDQLDPKVLKKKQKMKCEHRFNMLYSMLR